MTATSFNKLSFVAYMFLIRYYITVSLLAILAHINTVTADTLESTRKQLFENQRNLISLRKEKDQYQQQLAVAKGDKQAETLNIVDIRESIEVAEVLISNVSVLVAKQRLQLATLERGTPPTALDIALNKALNSNLPELIKNLSNNETARKEIARLRVLLKKQARIDTIPAQAGNAVLVAADKQVAEAEFLRLLALFSDGNADNAEDKQIIITGTSNHQSFTETEILTYLGHNQYHTETTVYSGEMTLTIDGRPWELNVATIEDQATYMVIYDITNKLEPRMVMFNKSLLLE